MKRVVKKVPQFKEVPDGTKDKITYIADDGTEFNNKKDAEKHDQKVYDAKYFESTFHPVVLEYYGEAHTAIYIKSLADKKKIAILTRKFHNLEECDFVKGWNLIETHYGDCYEEYSVTSVGSAIETLKFELDELIELKNKKP